MRVAITAMTSGLERCPMNFYDVIVIGAGPAGATLGYELGCRGLRVLIIEKEKLPRYKPCAGGITRRAASS